MSSLPRVVLALIRQVALSQLRGKVVAVNFIYTSCALPQARHFLTGQSDDVRRICDLFGVDFFQDEGLMNHPSHTAVIDRQGTLVANIEGNEFKSTQLGDLVEAVLKR